MNFISEHCSTFCDQINVVYAFTFNIFCPITFLFIPFSNFAVRYCTGSGRNFWLAKTAEKEYPQSRPVKACSDWMRHDLVHVGAVIFRRYIHRYAIFKMTLQKYCRVSSRKLFLEVGVTVYFSNLFLKSIPPRGGTKRHVSTLSL